MTIVQSMETRSPRSEAVVFRCARMVTVDNRVPSFAVRTSVVLDRDPSEVVSAVLRATAHGIYEAKIDGVPVSEAVLAPGWTSYELRLAVQEYDVTSMLNDGSVIEANVGNGWWRGGLGFTGMDFHYGEEIGFIGEFEIAFADGYVQYVGTSSNWDACTTPVGENSLYHGVCLDARAGGEPLTLTETHLDTSILVQQVKPPVVRQEIVQPLRIWESPSGRTLVDFGQNLTGWVRLRARGKSGSKIVVRHAEVLEDGELAVRPLRGARATDTFVLSGQEDEFEPTFTFHGFRYAEVTGFPGDLSIDDLEAVVIGSQMRRTGTFSCSEPLLNRLVENAVWGQKGNFIDIPTDCPQRDERLGWTGDIAVFADSACYQFDCADVLHGWMLDLREETQRSGYVPFVVPNLFHGNEQLGSYASLLGPTAIWGDAAAWVPEALWWAYGDNTRLSEHYPAIVRHLESVKPRLSESGLWDSGFQFGDWLDPTAPPERPLESKADNAVVATACLYRTASFAAHAAKVLGHSGDAARWDGLASRTRTAFRKNFVLQSGRIVSDAQTVYALAIHFGLLEPDERTAAGARLAELVEQSGYHVQTGFAGTPYVTWALSETGYVDTAYKLLLQTKNPSWLYAVALGATTIWERWDSLLPDGSVNPGEMTSFNHYALGAVVDWLYKCVAGIRPAEPGYSRLLLKPVPGPGLTWAHGSLQTPHGLVECGWNRDSQGINVSCTVPPGVTAEVHLPDGSIRTVESGSHVFTTRAASAG